MRTGKVLLVMVAVLAMAGAAGAQNLVENGSFEMPTVENTVQNWDYYPSGTDGLGWTVEWYQGLTSFNGRTRPADAYLELHKSGVITGVDAQEGNQYAELDTDWDGPGGGLNNEPASVYIYQEIGTCYGADYDLTFHYTRRPSYASSLGVYVDDAQVWSVSPSTGGVAWTEKTLSFTATGAKTKIGFKEEGTPDSFGMFLDNVTVTQESDCGSTVTLCEAQYDGIGNVYVYNDADSIYVEFTINSDEYPNRYLDEVHVAVASDPEDLPQTKKGNPIPGQFPYSCEDYDPITPLDTMCTARIPFSEIDGGCGPVYIAAHASVIQVAGDGCQSETFWANNVIDYEQGYGFKGSDITGDRAEVDNALGAPEDTPGADFFSLGFPKPLVEDEDGPIPSAGGFITVGFGYELYAESYPIFNGPGADIVSWERSPRLDETGFPCEKALVFGVDASGAVPGVSTIPSFVTNENGECAAGATEPYGRTTVEIPEEWITFDAVKLVDFTDPVPFLSNYNQADGFDVDAIGACYLFLGDETAWGAACEPADGILFTEKGNWGTYFAFAPACLD